ncbi:hypothetical protein MHF_0688 [Mycoplasma haemofelis Ohio2]|uniref:Uncharacterized protein n=1 Tax=Mycoplasma haemofelis (strain Ohio2) TaxID=859194 RepID=F6FIB0_MYCHI|nr:hypothetical protein MHF_0688 [Mycoplasma haemofelis Ohio2]
MLISEIVKVILGSTVVALGTGGLIHGFSSGNGDDLKTGKHQLTKSSDSEIDSDPVTEEDEKPEIQAQASEIEVIEEVKEEISPAVSEPQPKVEVPEEKGGCMIYVLGSSSVKPWRFKDPVVGDQFLSQNSTSVNAKKRIKEACDKAKGGGVLVFKNFRNNWWGEWDYSQEKQDGSEFKGHLQRTA